MPNSAWRAEAASILRSRTRDYTAFARSRPIVRTKVCTPMSFANRKPWIRSKPSSRAAIVLYTDCHRAGAELSGCTDDMASECLLRAIVRATRHQFGLDLGFDERKIPQLQERGPFAAKAINRDGDLA